MAATHTLRRLDNTPIPDDKGEIRAILKVRNEELRLPWVLRHHRDLGVGRFFVVDNGSTDGSVAYLLAQHDVHCFATDGGFSESHGGRDWIAGLLDAFGDGHWCLVIDADELFVYPAYETTPLSTLCAYLDQSGAQAVAAMLLDMYASTPVNATHYSCGEPLLAVCSYFDSEPYRMVPSDSVPPFKIFGGVRERVFWQDRKRDYDSPTLNKLPLIKWQKGLQYKSNHSMKSPVDISEVEGALLHFKFLSDFPERVKQEAERGEFFTGAREYRAYLDVLEQDPELTLFHEGSVHYRDSEQLVDLELMVTSKPYRRFVDNALSSPMLVDRL